MVTAMLGAIAEKVKEVPLWVRNTVAELLKANLDSHIENMGLMTAAIMAINPKNTIQVAANDEKFDIAA